MAKQYQCDGPVQEPANLNAYSLTYTYPEPEESDVILFNGPNSGWLAQEYFDWKNSEGAE